LASKTYDLANHASDLANQSSGRSI
jgi:hypothetical protein